MERIHRKLPALIVWIMAAALMLGAGAGAQEAYASEADVGEAAWERDYDLPWDDQLLPGWTGWINRNFHAWAQSKEEPDGRDYDLEVTDVQISGDENVLSLEDRGDGWEYRAENFGDALVQLTFTDIDGSEQTHT